MKVDFDFMPELLSIRDLMQALSKRRDDVVSHNSDTIIKKVLIMMDWSKDDILDVSVKYSAFEKRIMIEVCLKKDSSARYVFELSGKSELNLRYREDFAKQY